MEVGGKKTLAELAREFYNGKVDEAAYRKKRAEILDHLEDKPVVDMDATLPLPRKSPRIETLPESGVGNGMNTLPRLGWILLGCILLIILLAVVIGGFGS